MRVLIINAVSDRSERALYLGLFKQGVNLELILDPRDPAIDSLRSQGIPVTPLHIAHRLDRNASKEIRRILIDRPVDLIYAPANRGVAAALRAGRGLKLAYVTYRGTLGNLSLLNPTVLLTHRNRRVNAIICNCEAVKQYLLDLGLAASKVYRVYKGHDLGWYLPKARLSRAELGVRPDDFVVVMVANVRALKGVDVLAASISKLKQKIPIKLLLVGQGDERYIQRIKKRYGLEQNLLALGFRNDVPEILKLSDLSIMASTRREGFPRAIVESMANNLPVIVTSIGGMKEIVQDGESGLVVPPSDPEALAQAIEKLYLDPTLRANLGHNGRKRVEDKLNLERYISEMRSVFQSAREAIS